MKTIKHYFKNVITSQKYTSRFNLINLYSILNGVHLRNPSIALRKGPRVFLEIQKLFWEDAENTRKGIYPDNLGSNIHKNNDLKNFWEIVKDYGSVIESRKKKKTKVESEYPNYFSRKFHFQTDGYTTEESAKLYSQQVEILFGGTAQLMRKLLVKHFLAYFEKSKEYNFLEVGCGVGEGSMILNEVFKKSQISATDISSEYIEYANKNNKRKNIKYIQADGTNLEVFNDGEFDGSFQIFLSHELPKSERIQVLKEQIRVLKSGGVGFFMDSLQVGDKEGWDEILYDFPKRYHEPFYKNYIENPLEGILIDLGVEILEVEKSLFSKAISFRKI